MLRACLPLAMSPSRLTERQKAQIVEHASAILLHDLSLLKLR